VQSRVLTRQEISAIRVALAAHSNKVKERLKNLAEDENVPGIKSVLAEYDVDVDLISALSSNNITVTIT
jgi:hypothetical protein